jgi:Prenyltransferase and squalene oxidase repeat
MKRMKHALKSYAREARARLLLPAAAKAEIRLDRAGLPLQDAGSQRVLVALMEWLCLAQDRSLSADGGVARDYSLVKGWASSYPETTGYIINTFLEYARRSGQPVYRERARRMADWLVSIQLPDGGFQGGKIDSTPVVPVTFNTGQILLGLTAAQVELGGYVEPMRRAADWLVSTQDPDGCWRSHPSPFAAPGEKEYETHVAWGLFEAARVEPDRGYGEAGMANVRWALSSQRTNGWLARCCLDDPTQPLTHTLGYALRGVLEAYRFSGERDLLDAARKTADGLIGALGEDGHLPGRLRSDWSAAVNWACLTGVAQVATCWLLMFHHTQETRYRDAAFMANKFVRRAIRIEHPLETMGGVKGSFPIDGDYGQFEYLNWAAKFVADSLMLEIDIEDSVEMNRPQKSGSRECSAESDLRPVSPLAKPSVW